MFLSLSVLGVSINGYASNIAQDVAIEAARYASLADTSQLEAQNRALDELRLSLGFAFEPVVSISRVVESGICSNLVSIRLQAISLGLLTAAIELEESASAVCEIQG
jgi:hypothetical protein